MARYNTSLASATINAATTISSPIQGAFTALTGSAPYTVTLPAPSSFPGSNQTFYNATSGTITLTTPAGIFTGTGGSGLTTTSIFTGNVVSVTSDGTNYIVISEDGSILTATTGSFSGDVTMNGGSAVVSITAGTLNIAPTNSSNINNVAIGATTRASGAFTTLAANNSVSFTANTASSTTTTGTLVVTGGIGVSGTVTASTVNATNLGGTLSTASQPNVTSVGTLTGLITSGNVGIGVTTASARLHVADAALKTQPQAQTLLLSTATSGTNDFQLIIGRSAAGAGANYNIQSVEQGVGYRDLVLQPNGGGVGIGTASPATKLHVAGAGNRSGGNITIGEPNNNVAKWSYLVSTHYAATAQPQGFSLIGGYTDSVANRVVIGGSIYESNPATEIQFWTHTATTHNLGGSQRMVINTNGNVGINNSDPQYKLDIGYGAGTAAGSGVIKIGGTGGYQSLEFGIKGAYDGMIRTYGNDLHLYAGHWRDTAVSSENHTMYFYTSQASSSNWSTPKMTLSNVGNLTITGTLTESSSITLKENVDPIYGALASVLQLSGKIYDRIDNKEKREAGLIAEEVYKVLPNLVHLDENGKPAGVKYTKTVAYLVESIKELYEEIRKLKGQ